MTQERITPSQRAYVAQEFSPDAPIKHLVRDGLLLASAGVRMATKNLIITRALRDFRDYDEGYYTAAVMQEFLAMASQARAEVKRVKAARASAARIAGRPSHHSDYRKADLPALDRRIKVLSRLAKALTEASENPQQATMLVSAARESALDEIAAAAVPESTAGVGRDGLARYSDGLEQRRAGLIHDLRALAADRVMNHGRVD